MKLAKYKEKNKLTYDDLVILLDIKKTKLHRICSETGYTLNIKDALNIQSRTNYEVALEDLV